MMLVSWASFTSLSLSCHLAANRPLVPRKFNGSLMLGVLLEGMKTKSFRRSSDSLQKFLSDTSRHHFQSRH